ncbi:MAG: zinc metallopeptidase [Luteolibacter sp.]
MNLDFLLLAQQAQQTGYMGIGFGYWIIIGASMLASFLVSHKLKSRFNEYSQVPTRWTGAEVAEMMLRQNGITDVRVISTPGHLTDHYDPVSKTVNLSEPVYHMNSVAAAAVAAHECGHAVQHQQAYHWLDFRSKMVPAVQFSTNALNMIMMLSIFGAAFFSPAMIWIYVALFSVTTLFAVVTLPVEFDASRRALVWMENSGVTNTIDHGKAKNALFWAAMTYTVAAIGSIAQLLYFLMMALGGRRED